MVDNINVITLEDDIEYAIIEEIIHDDKKYVFLTNVNDYEDFCIRKVIIDGNEQFLVGLDDDVEFDLALMLFAKNHKEEISKFN